MYMVPWLRMATYSCSMASLVPHMGYGHCCHATTITNAYLQLSYIPFCSCKNTTGALLLSSVELCKLFQDIYRVSNIALHCKNKYFLGNASLEYLRYKGLLTARKM